MISEPSYKCTLNTACFHLFSIVLRAVGPYDRLQFQLLIGTFWLNCNVSWCFSFVWRSYAWNQAVSSYIIKYVWNTYSCVCVSVCVCVCVCVFVHISLSDRETCLRETTVQHFESALGTITRLTCEWISIHATAFAIRIGETSGLQIILQRWIHVSIFFKY